MSSVAAVPPARRVASRPARAVSLGLFERRALLVLGDLLFLNGGLAMITSVVPRPAWLDVFEGPPFAIEWFVVLTVFWIVAAVVTDCYDLELARNRFTSPFRVLQVVTVVLIAYSLVPFVTPPVLKSRLMLGVLIAMTMAALAGWRLIYAALLSHAGFVHHVVIVGTNEAGRLIAETVRRFPASGYRVLGFVSEQADINDASIGGLPVLGSAAQLPELLMHGGVDELVVTGTDLVSGEGLQAITAAYEAGVRVTPMATLYERLTGRIPVQHVGDHWLIMLPQDSGASAIS